MMLTEGELVRFWPKVDTDHGDDECWPWTGNRVQGYGRFKREGGPRRRAQRVMWEAMHGEIPEGRHVLHTCDNRACVNPQHLWLGTNADNVADRHRKGRSVRGERQGQAKLTRDQVLEIRALVEEGDSLRPVGRAFGVSHSTVWRIVHRTNWAWLEGGHCG